VRLFFPAFHCPVDEETAQQNEDKGPELVHEEVVGNDVLQKENNPE
jgi:hypothetical protein